jgi:hypothetical protein
MRRTLRHLGAAAALIAVLAAGTACASRNAEMPGGDLPSPTAHMTTFAPSGTPTPSRNVDLDTARLGKAVALEWCSTMGLPRPAVTRFYPASSGTEPDVPLVAVRLTFPHQVTLPPGIPMGKSHGEEGAETLPLGEDVYSTVVPYYGTNVIVLVDPAAERVYVVTPIGLSREP